jgi:hypothetical protein
MPYHQQRSASKPGSGSRRSVSPNATVNSPNVAATTSRAGRPQAGWGPHRPVRGRGVGAVTVGCRQDGGAP